LIKANELHEFSACLPAKAGIMVLLHAFDMKKNILTIIF